MWRRESRRAPDGGFWTPPPAKKRVYASMPMSERKIPTEKQEPFHMNHRVSSGDSPYVRAKHAQLICKDPDRAISLFWAAINAGDCVDGALKDMAVVMKQLDRSNEAIEAIKSFRYLCPFESQDSIDNLLLELYKKSGRIQEEAELLEHKLKNLEQDTRTKKRNGKHVEMTIEQEKARILGNLAWVHLQLHNYGIAEQYYRSALSLEPDNNKLCNLAICLMRMDRIPEAKSLLEDVRQSLGNQWKDEQFYKSFERANEMLAEKEQAVVVADNPGGFMTSSSSDNFSSSCSFATWLKEKRALAEPGNMHKTNSHVSSESVNQNSRCLITQTRECKWGDEEVNQGTVEVTIGAARRLRFGKPLEVEYYQKSVGSNTNKEALDGKKLDQNLIEQLHQEPGILRIDSAPTPRLRFRKDYQKNLRTVKSAVSATKGKKLDQKLINELHEFAQRSMTNKARKLCEDLVKEKEDNDKGCQSSASESSAYAQIMVIGQTSI